MSELHDLYNAVERGDTERIRQLVSCYRRELDPGDGAMSHAALENPAMIPVLVEFGIDVDERDSVGGTVLMHFAATGASDMVRALLALGADIDARNNERETPFSFACAWDQLDTAKLLHDMGADVNCVHQNGGTPMDDLCQSERILEFLASIGAKRQRELR